MTRLLNFKEAIAKGFGAQHRNVLALLDKYAAEFAAFGSVAFETRLRRNGGKPTSFALLNEQQAGLLLTLMRNTDEVVAFKVRLIAEFFRMREALQNGFLTNWLHGASTAAWTTGSSTYQAARWSAARAYPDQRRKRAGSWRQGHHRGDADRAPWIDPTGTTDTPCKGSRGYAIAISTDRQAGNRM